MFALIVISLHWWYILTRNWLKKRYWNFRSFIHRTQKLFILTHFSWSVKLHSACDSITNQSGVYTLSWPIRTLQYHLATISRSQPWYSEVWTGTTGGQWAEDCSGKDNYFDTILAYYTIALMSDFRFRTSGYFRSCTIYTPWKAGWVEILINVLPCL